MTAATEYWVSGIMFWSWAIVIALVAALAMFWLIEMPLRKPVERVMKKMLKEGKITMRQFDYYERYMWWNYGRTH
jgi:peptidoglycan/LPS O-acetylase OafA/YrhL